MNVFEIHNEQIVHFCKENGYSVEKLKSLPRCGNKTCAFFQVLSNSANNKGLRDERPAEVVLSFVVDKNGIYKFSKGSRADSLLKN